MEENSWRARSLIRLSFLIIHNMYSSPNAIRMISSRNMGGTGRVALIGRRGVHIGFWWKSEEERDK
jgi:hypothetical protein